MSDVIIWHNPRCSKSRASLQLLEEQGIEPKVINYLEDRPTKNEIIRLLILLNMYSARELMRTKEAIYKELNLKDENSEKRLIEAMVAYPKLIERPIVIKDNLAVIGRPIEKVIELIRG